MVYLLSVENVITLSKLIGCFFFLSPPPLSFVFENSENKRNDLARPVMGTIFLVSVHYWASKANPTPGCSIEISGDIYMYVGMSVCLSYVKLTA